MHTKRTVVLLLLLLLPALAETRQYVNEAYKFSFSYPSDFRLNTDEAQLRQLMDAGHERLDTSKMPVQVREAMKHIGPQFMLASPDGAVLICITTPIDESQLAIPTLELARASLQEALEIIPGSSAVAEPTEVTLGENHLVRYELDIVTRSETPVRQRQYMVRNSDLRVLYLFAITSASSKFATDAVPFETILQSLNLNFSTGDRGQG